MFAPVLAELLEALKKQTLNLTTSCRLKPLGVVCNSTTNHTMHGCAVVHVSSLEKEGVSLAMFATTVSLKINHVSNKYLTVYWISVYRIEGSFECGVGCTDLYICTCD